MANHELDYSTRTLTEFVDLFFQSPVFIKGVNVKLWRGQCIIHAVLLDLSTRENITPEELKNVYVRLNYLKEIGADFNVQNNDGKSPLCIELSDINENIVLIKLLLNHGADPNEINANYGSVDDGPTTPLRFALVEEKTPTLVEVLLASGVNPNAKDTNEVYLVNLRRRFFFEASKKLEILLRYGMELYPTRDTRIFDRWDAMFFNRENHNGEPRKILMLLLTYIAREQCNNKYTNPQDLEEISRWEPDVYEILDDIRNEIEEARITRYYQGYNYYEILFKKEHVFYKYAKNKDFRSLLKLPNGRRYLGNMIKKKQKRIRYQLKKVRITRRHVKSILEKILPETLNDDIAYEVIMMDNYRIFK